MKNLIILLLCMLSFSAFAQVWEVPENDKANLSPVQFDEDFTQEGAILYGTSCISCHGNPGSANFSVMIPSPGDPASERFQEQSDGALFYKVLQGRNAMPAFQDVLSDEEIWSLVAYMRSFNPSYEQTLKEIKGLVKHDFQLALSFDENVSKLVVKVMEKDEAVEGVQVNAFVKAMFGKLRLGKAMTNEKGLAFLDVDTKLPGDKDGKMTFITKVSKDYSSAKKEAVLTISDPVKKKSAIEGRHLWSTNKNAPLWLIVVFWSVCIGIWAAILYILFGIRKLKSYAEPQS